MPEARARPGGRARSSRPSACRRGVRPSPPRGPDHNHRHVGTTRRVDQAGDDRVGWTWKPSSRTNARSAFMPGTIAPTGRSSATAPLASHVENFARRSTRGSPLTPCAAARRTPEASLRFACGQCATCTRAAASSARSSSETQTQWASSVRSLSAPSSSSCSTGVRPTRDFVFSTEKRVSEQWRYPQTRVVRLGLSAVERWLSSFSRTAAPRGFSVDKLCRKRFCGCY